MERKYLPSRMSEVAKTVDEIANRVEQLGYSSEEVFAVRLAAEEAITNAVIHGNKLDPTKHVILDCEFTPQQVKMCVEDEGEGFDPCSIPDPTDEENLLTPCGRGMLLMREFMDSVDYTPRGNCVILTKKKGAASGAGAIHRLEAQVLSNTPFLGRFCRLRLDAPEIAAAISAGQFVNILIGEERRGKRTFDEWDEVRRTLAPDYSSRRPFLRRPFSLHRLHRDEAGEPDGSFSVVFAVVGPGTEALASLKAGDKVNALGPLGRPVNLARHQDVPVALLAGGMGLAPMLAAAEELSRLDRQTVLLVGASAKDHIPAHMSPAESNGAPTLDEFRELGVDVRVVTEADDDIPTGLATDLLREFLAGRGEGCEVIACGPTAMLRETARLCSISKTPCQVLMEEMMGCGFGACMSCSIPTKSGPARVCIDGPAFDAEDILWEDGWARDG